MKKTLLAIVIVVLTLTAGVAFAALPTEQMPIIYEGIFTESVIPTEVIPSKNAADAYSVIVKAGNIEVEAFFIDPVEAADFLTKAEIAYLEGSELKFTAQYKIKQNLTTKYQILGKGIKVV